VNTVELQPQLEQEAAARSQRIRLVYLLAASHSGSTLLAMLLGSHPEICSVGELKLTSMGSVDQYLCSCRTPIRNCSFWNAVREEMAARAAEFDIADAGTDLHWHASPYVSRLLRPLHRGPMMESVREAALNLSPDWRRNIGIIQRKNLNLIQSIAELTGKSTIADSSKIGLRLKYLLRIPELDVRVIRLVRDGRAVSLTYIDPCAFADSSNPNLRGGGTGTTREDECLSMREAAREWLRSNEEAEAILTQLDPSQWMQVRYEDLCANPAHWLNQIFSFLHLDPALRSSDFRAVSHHVLGNGMRLDNTSEIKLDERWRSVLSVEQLLKFERVAGAMNRRLGYRS
jgi:Sulfotransferase family